MKASILLTTITDPSQYAYDTIKEIVRSSEDTDKVYTNLQSLIDNVRKTMENIESLKTNRFIINDLGDWDENKFKS